MLKDARNAKILLAIVLNVKKVMFTMQLVSNVRQRAVYQAANSAMSLLIKCASAVIMAITSSKIKLA